MLPAVELLAQFRYLRFSVVMVVQSRPQSPRSFWSAPRIEGSGQDRFGVRESRTSGSTAQSQPLEQNG